MGLQLLHGVVEPAPMDVLSSRSCLGQISRDWLFALPLGIAPPTGHPPLAGPRS
jgi:hypothetical protein